MKNKRVIEERKISELERVVLESALHVGIEITDGQCALLLRLIFSAIGQHFFFNPDTKYRIGFIEVSKSPNIDELFNVSIIRSEQDDILNADLLHKYYTGDLAREQQLKEVLDTFVNQLLAYSQEQEISIGMLTNNIAITKENKKVEKEK